MDSDLLSYARTCSSSSSPPQKGKTALRQMGDVLAVCSPADFFQLSPLQRTIEVNRCHAEALLALCKAGELKLDDSARKTLTERALGILPTSEGERLLEIAACQELDPRYLTSNPSRLLNGLEEIELEFGSATALCYGFLLMAGVRSSSDLHKYGTRVEELLQRLMRRPGVHSALATVNTCSAKRLRQTERIRLLRSIREALWQECSNRVGAAFLLTQVIDGYLGLRPGGVGDSLGLAVIDTLILTKLGFPVRHLGRGDRVYLEVVVSEYVVEHWDPLDMNGTVPVPSCHRLGLADLLLRGYERMARGYANRSQFAHGERIANWLLAMKVDYAPAYQLLGQCLLGQNRPKEAVTACARAIQLNPLLAEAYLTQGNALSALNQWQEAIDSYKRAIQLQVGFAEAYNNLGLALWRSGQPEKAVGAFWQAIRVRRDYAEAYYNLGTLYAELNQPDSAITAFQRAVEIAPGFAQAYYNLGMVYYSQKNLEAALAAYQAAVKANPKHAGAWHNLGIVYRDMGRQELAVEAIEKAVQLNPILLR
ncbi:MAG: tetratricopeptide repeat protein [candidate division WOR-3 bacterium]